MTSPLLLHSNTVNALNMPASSGSSKPQTIYYMEVQQVNCRHLRKVMLSTLTSIIVGLDLCRSVIHLQTEMFTSCAKEQPDKFEIAIS